MLHQQNFIRKARTGYSQPIKITINEPPKKYHKPTVTKKNRLNLKFNRLRNGFHSLIFLGGMALLLGLLGWNIAGYKGILWSLGVGVISILLTPSLPPHWVFKLLKGRPMSSFEFSHLYQLMEHLSERAELSHVPQLYYVPSKTMNAFSVGNQKEAAIGMTHGLLEQLNNREMAGVLAHEIAHIRNNDIWLMGLADNVRRLTRILAIFGWILLLFKIPLLSVQQTYIPWSFILLLWVAPLFSFLMQLALARTREFSADLGAIDLTGDPIGLATALEKINRVSKLWKRFFPGEQMVEVPILQTHPQHKQRIKRLLNLAEQPEFNDSYPNTSPRVKEGIIDYWPY